jgi:hypothetical protein
MLNTWIIPNLIGVLLGTSALEEEAVVADGEWSLQPGKRKTQQEETISQRERYCKHSPWKKGKVIHC